MNTYEIINTYFKGKDPEPLLRVLNKVVTAVNKLPEEDQEQLNKDIYYALNGGHYDECFAKLAVGKMYYTVDREKHYAPYWMRSEIENIWNKHKGEIEESDYTMWDFYVTMNMLMSDNYKLLEERYPNSSKDEKTKIIVEDTINYLNDEDNPFGSEKIWGYLNAKL